MHVDDVCTDSVHEVLGVRDDHKDSLVAAHREVARSIHIVYHIM